MESASGKTTNRRRWWDRPESNRRCTASQRGNPRTGCGCSATELLSHMWQGLTTPALF